MAIKRVILHLGMAKAGSSSIQHTLFNNTDVLEKNGFRYLAEWEENHLIKFKYLFSQYPVSPASTGHLGRPLKNRKQKSKNAVNTMLQVIKTSKCETLILSGEFSAELWINSTIENIKGFIEKYFKSVGIETTIIFLVRNPLTWITSFLQQRLFKDGFMNKNGDFFEFAMKQYDGVINLKNHFPDSLELLKFEDACLDKDGLVGRFLKTAGFPEEALKHINITRTNESRCTEVMELVNYVESVESRHPYDHYRHVNPNRYTDDFNCIINIKGVKFDLPYQSKVEFWERFRETIFRLKENAGIDYTGHEIISHATDQETYSEQTIQGFIEAFPKLSFILQRHFLKFFEKKYMETAQVKFKQLHFKDSIPYTIYSKKNIFISGLIFHLKNNLQAIKKAISSAMPYKVKTSLKQAFGKG